MLPAIETLPEWGEVWVWAGTCPFEVGEHEQLRSLVEQFLINWAAKMEDALSIRPVVSRCELYYQQALAYGYASVPPPSLKEQQEASHHYWMSYPYRMTGTDIDPLLDAFSAYQRQRLPKLEIHGVDVAIVEGEVVPGGPAWADLARAGRFTGDSLIIRGGTVELWQRLGAIHRLRDDQDYYDSLKQILAKDGITLR